MAMPERSSNDGRMGHKNEPPIPAPVLVFSLAVPPEAPAHTPVIGEKVTQLKTLSVKNRCRPNTSKWAQPGSKATFSMISGYASVVKVLVMPEPKNEPPAFAKFT